MNEDTEKELFRELDGKFINFDESLDSYNLSSTDMLIQWNFVLEIPILLSDAVISYKFSTTGGDISFGMNFLSNKNDEENEIIPNQRCPSDTEEIVGTYKVPSEGTIVIYWDNSFSWFTPKNLTYLIEIAQPTFAAADRSRAINAGYLINHTKREMEEANAQLTVIQANQREAQQELPQLQSEFRRLRELLDNKLALLEQEVSHNQIMNEYIENQKIKLNGLCIRALPKHVLQIVLSYLTDSIEVYLVSRYWNQIMKSISSSSPHHNSSPQIGPPPLVICGPAGVGKGTLINLLIQKYPTILGFSVSHTTRPPRPGEVNGVHYYFTTIEKMREEIQQNKFIEHAQVHTNYYGTSYEAVNKLISEGKICMLDLDVQGVQSLKRLGLPYHFIFIAPPTMGDLDKRLRGRATETNEKILIRLENAKKEVEYGLTPGNFEEIFVNETVEGTFEKIVRYLEGTYGRYGFHF